MGNELLLSFAIKVQAMSAGECLHFYVFLTWSLFFLVEYLEKVLSKYVPNEKKNNIHLYAGRFSKSLLLLPPSPWKNTKTDITHSALVIYGEKFRDKSALGKQFVRFILCKHGASDKRWVLANNFVLKINLCFSFRLSDLGPGFGMTGVDANFFSP